MRPFRFIRGAVALPHYLQGHEYGEYGKRNSGGHETLQGEPQTPLTQQRFIHRGSLSHPTEPQLVARLLELFPTDKTWVPVSKWAQAMPDEVREVLVAYDGLGNFTSSQTNFFIVRSENGVKMVSLSTMGMRLCRERARQSNYERKRADKDVKFGRRRNSWSSRGGCQQRIQ